MNTEQILDEIQPCSVRAVCYRLFSAGVIESMEVKHTARVSRQLVEARERGVIPWGWIVDETREAEVVPSWRDGSWRTYHYIRRNGNLYPCHGLGPVAQYMNLARTEDTFGHIVSFSSPSRVRALYAKANFPADHKWNKEKFIAGDISTSIAKTALGRTIMVQ